MIALLTRLDMHQVGMGSYHHTVRATAKVDACWSHIVSSVRN